MLRCIIRHETNPHFNLAAEEYFLKNVMANPRKFDRPIA